MGNGLKEFDTVLDLCVQCGPLGMQIRDNAIESARLIVNRRLIKDVGKDEFFIKVRIYPHHILRENKQAQGAGADRVSKGMSHCFGKAVGRAARVRDGQIILSVLIMEKDIKKATKAMLLSNSRLACDILVKVHHDVESIGTKPTKTRDMRTEEEEKAAAEAAATPEAAAAPEAKKGDKKEDAKAGAKGKEPVKAAEKKDDKKDAKKK